MCTARAWQQWFGVGSTGCTIHAAEHAVFRRVQRRGTKDKKLVNVSGPDSAGHVTVHTGLHWLLLHDSHTADVRQPDIKVHGVSCSAECFRYLKQSPEE